MTEKYIGLENELMLFSKNNNIIKFTKNRFQKIKRKQDYSKYDTAIRTAQGNAIYIDLNEIEIVTPPIAINKGFATRLTDSLTIGRNRVIESFPNNRFTGYSMHWNLSLKSEDHIFFNIIKPVLSLFTQTPLSSGVAIRRKTKSNERIELVGDSIDSRDQINATALFLGAYSHAYENCKHNYQYFRILDDISLDAERKFKNIDRNENLKLWYPYIVDYINISAQNYLESLFKAIYPYINSLGTQKEIGNLEDFVFNKKKLERDKVEKYDYLLKNKLFSCGIYYPSSSNKAVEASYLKLEKIVNEIPLEGQLLGKLTSSLKNKILTIDWNNLKLNAYKNNKLLERLKNENFDTIFRILHVTGIGKIYDIASKINYPSYKQKAFKPSSDLNYIDQNFITELDVYIDEKKVKTQENIQNKGNGIRIYI